MNFCVWPARLRVCTYKRTSREKYRWRGVDGHCGTAAVTALVTKKPLLRAIIKRLGRKIAVFNTKIQRFWYITAD